MAIKDLVYGTKYTDKATGEEKTRWSNHGAVMIKDDGSISVKVESIPVNFTGWFSVFDRKPKDAAQAPRPKKDTGSKGAHAADFEDDIPF